MGAVRWGVAVYPPVWVGLSPALAAARERGGAEGVERREAPNRAWSGAPRARRALRRAADDPR